MADDVPEIMTLSSTAVYQNRWMKVREDIVERQDGSQGVYGVVEKNDFSLIVPIDAAGTVYLVEQFRYPVGKRFWELPQGSWEEQEGVDPLELAHGELQEETGLVADDMTYVGQLLKRTDIRRRDAIFSSPAVCARYRRTLTLKNKG
ncbi:NUDIX hydrolase [Rhizobium sp. PL01]|uniref:NUDIX hydrolase n=1 Tax=Rhizobium sp. PL01 TaxID=3085631 RepID=UPI002982AAE1|nr:NUDIX hydrolase [Rhizobium sp. PL01]MDW5314036.1 NUDIX hydrolase [Rhizobium sp. PL01]